MDSDRCQYIHGRGRSGAAPWTVTGVSTPTAARTAAAAETDRSFRNSNDDTCLSDTERGIINPRRHRGGGLIQHPSPSFFFQRWRKNTLTD